MVRSVGGVIGHDRAARSTAVGGPATKAGGTTEAGPASLRSGPAGDGVAGGGGRPGASQSHRAGRASGLSPWSGRGSSACAGISQQQPGVAAVRFTAQQGRSQHGCGFGADEVKGCVGDSGGAGFRAAGVQPQARVGTVAPIAVETASNRHTNGRTRHRIGMKASYTRSIIAVNSIYRSTGKVVRTPLQSELFVRDPLVRIGTCCGPAFRVPVADWTSDALDRQDTRRYNAVGLCIASARRGPCGPSCGDDPGRRSGAPAARHVPVPVRSLHGGPARGARNHARVAASGRPRR